jgi:hypothetical protein
VSGKWKRGLPAMSESHNAVFLSYASEDAAAAERICATLRAAGIEVWFDKSELRGGDAWDAAIRRQIKACALFVPVISANTRARVEGYFRLEWKLAIDRSHLIATERAFLLPVVIDGIKEADGWVPERFREVQWRRASSAPVGVGTVGRSGDNPDGRRRRCSNSTRSGSPEPADTLALASRSACNHGGGHHRGRLFRSSPVVALRGTRARDSGG